jgi:arabinose-5-phosphate isomerase
MQAFRKSLTLGVDSLLRVNDQLDHVAAKRVVDAFIACPGRRYFTGIGKSGLAAARMASSLTSIGLASHWVHGSEWAHGELGALKAGDLITTVSHSGGTAELVWLMQQLDARQELYCGSHHWMSSLARNEESDSSLPAMADSGGATSTGGVGIVSLTGDATSMLASGATLSLTYPVPASAEALELLPTSSVLAVHHIFNALLCECADRMQLSSADVMRHHPGGNVGASARGRAGQ